MAPSPPPAPLPPPPPVLSPGSYDVSQVFGNAPAGASPGTRQTLQCALGSYVDAVTVHLSHTVAVGYTLQYVGAPVSPRKPSMPGPLRRLTRSYDIHVNRVHKSVHLCPLRSDSICVGGIAVVAAPAKLNGHNRAIGPWLHDANERHDSRVHRWAGRTLQ